MIMEQVNVGIKKLHKDAVIPKYAKKGDAGLDLTAVEVEYNYEMDCYIYHTGIALEIPEGYVGLIFPRSSNRKKEAYLTNHVGVIDSGYRGEVLVCYKNRTSDAVIEEFNSLENNVPVYSNYLHNDYPYAIGDRVAQLMILPYPKVVFIEKDELSETDRGDGGHGSTGK